MEGPDKMQAGKEKPSASENDGAMQGDNEILNLPFLIYDVLRIIFQYLNGRDLSNAAMVCKSWLEAVYDEKSKRGPCCFYITNITAFSDCLKNIRIKPSIDIKKNVKFFRCSLANAKKFSDVQKLYREKNESTEFLPKHCEIIKVYCMNNYLANSTEKESGYFTFFTVCALLPQIPNVKIKSFKLEKLHDYNSVIQETAEFREIIRTINNYETSSHETSTCFMLFSNFRGASVANCWALAIEKSIGSKIASICGGVIVNIYSKHVCSEDSLRKLRRKQIGKNYFRTTEPACCVAVLITGSIQTWSMILNNTYGNNTEEQIEPQLRLFKDKVKLKKYSIGFVFVDTDRRFLCQEIGSNVVLSFKRIFPEVLFIGSGFKNVFGKTTIVDERNEKKSSKKLKVEDYEEKCNNKYSSIVILTYG